VPIIAAGTAPAKASKTDKASEIMGKKVEKLCVCPSKLVSRRLDYSGNAKNERQTKKRKKTPSLQRPY